MSVYDHELNPSLTLGSQPPDVPDPLWHDRICNGSQAETYRSLQPVARELIDERMRLQGRLHEELIVHDEIRNKYTDLLNQRLQGLPVDETEWQIAWENESRESAVEIGIATAVLMAETQLCRAGTRSEPFLKLTERRDLSVCELSPLQPGEPALHHIYFPDGKN